MTKPEQAVTYQQLYDAADAVVARSGHAATSDDLLVLLPSISRDLAEEAVEWARNRLRVIEFLEGQKAA